MWPRAVKGRVDSTPPIPIPKKNNETRKQSTGVSGPCMFLEADRGFWGQTTSNESQVVFAAGNVDYGALPRVLDKCFDAKRAVLAVAYVL